MSSEGREGRKDSRAYVDHVVELSQPINAYGEQLTKLTFSLPARMNLGDARLLDKAEGQVHATVLFISKYANIPPKAAESIDLGDLDAINEILNPFFETSPRTGKS